VIADTMYLLVEDQASERSELWASDGTAAGTRRVMRFAGDIGLSGLVAAGEVLYFLITRTTGVMEQRTTLWRSDGTTAGTRQVSPTRWLWASRLTPVGSRIYFAAGDATHGEELWRTNGTAAGTRLVRDIKTGGSGSSSPRELTRLGDMLVFVALGPGGRELWKSDGTSGGTVRVRDIRPDGSSSPAGLVARGSTVFFSANDGSSGRELWRTDGTSTGTRRVRDIRPGAGSSSPHGLTNVGEVIAFAANDGEHGVEPWQSDGSADGTVMVGDLRVDGSSLPVIDDPDGIRVELGAAGGRAYVVADDAAHGWELWSWTP
jgi:ELWxxDGT repeat protein